jgi:hypothetical protein
MDQCCLRSQIGLQHLCRERHGVVRHREDADVCLLQRIVIGQREPESRCAPGRFA